MLPVPDRWPDRSLALLQCDQPSVGGGLRAHGAKTGSTGSWGLGTVVHTPLPDVVIHAITDANLLSTKPVVASSVYNESFSPTYATDGTTNDQVFSDGDVGRMVVHGIGSGMGVIRIWQDLADTNRIPSRVTIRSSTSDTTSLDPASFETPLADLTSPAFQCGRVCRRPRQCPGEYSKPVLRLRQRRFARSALRPSHRRGSGISRARAAGHCGPGCRARRNGDRPRLETEERTRSRKKRNRLFEMDSHKTGTLRCRRRQG